MPTIDSRETIHSLLEANLAELLLKAAIEDGKDASRDGDVLRALMQASLAEGDMETVRATASRLIALGIADGNLMLSLEGLCLLRNVGGDTEVPVQDLLDALDARGFHDEILDYVDWTPNLDAAKSSTEPFPPAATTLALLSEQFLKPSEAPFGWVTLWPHLNRESREQLLESLHFEMRQPGDAALQPPRIVAGWITSGELAVDGIRYRCIPGTMLAQSLDTRRLVGGKHLRLVGLRQERWDALQQLPDFNHAWKQTMLRLTALSALEGIAQRAALSEETLRQLLERATMSHPGSSGGAESQARTLLVLEGHLELPLCRDTEVIVSTIGPGTLLSVPAGIALTELTASVLRWSTNTLEQIIPLEQFTVLEVAAART